MAIQQVNLGAIGTGAGGDSARTAFEKMNQNFSNSAHAASKMVQTSPADTTAGALMAVGAFGLGATSTGVYSDCNALTNAGFYSLDGSAANRPPWVGTAASSLLVMVGGISSRCSQIHYYDSASRPLIGIRHRSPSGWGDWREIFHQGNILGTVSQSGGVPTGAAFQAISNTNGFCLRMLDGTQICWLGNAPAEAGLRVASVSAGATGTVIWEFPAAFIAPPQVTADWGSNDGSIRVNGQPQRLSNRSTTQCPINWQALLSVGGTACQLDAIAIGRWYN